MQGHQTGRREQFWTIHPGPSSIDLSSHHWMVNSLLNQSEVIIRSMKDGDDDRTFKLGPIVTMGFKCQKQNPPNPLQKDSPVPCICCKKTPKQSTEEPFACPATPTSIMIINNMPIGSPLAPSSPQSHNEAWQVFMDLRLTLTNP
ncbi:hypothetical protein O181_090919 [Austropuccinia psidii MF-1]|uniref:Uncharacterized protein n=1 Tax=Austropuccinia psidii MF-1 TaxID=1389203 RepID=A0A9Q3IWC4_9BASI|nr:hypothetical protein [Austropuccinia psidii MF-1]